MKKAIPFILLIITITIGAFSIATHNNIAGIETPHCCNWVWPPAPPNGYPDWASQMNCDGVEYQITHNICARYWSAYLDYEETNPTKMCEYLLGTPPLPNVPIPGNFNVYVTDDDHLEIVWTHYHVHEYRIYRKIGNGS